MIEWILAALLFYLIASS